MEHGFSDEMKSKKYVKNMSISDEAHGQVLFEGNLGELRELSLVEGDVLEFTGVNGVLRINITDEQLHHVLLRKSRVKPQLQGGELYNPTGKIVNNYKYQVQYDLICKYQKREIVAMIELLWTP